MMPHCSSLSSASTADATVCRDTTVSEAQLGPTITGALGALWNAGLQLEGDRLSDEGHVDDLVEFVDDDAYVGVFAGA